MRRYRDPGFPSDRDTKKEPREFTNARTAEYRWIRVVEFIDQIPQTIGNKIYMAALRQ